MKMNYPIESMIKLDKETKTSGPIVPYGYNDKILKLALNDEIFRNHVYEIKRMVFIYAKFYEYTLGMQDKLSILIEKETNWFQLPFTWMACYSLYWKAA